MTPDVSADCAVEFELTTFAHGTRREFRVAARDSGDGRVTVYCTSLPGAVSDGEDVHSAVEALRLVIADMADAYREMGEPIPYRPVELEQEDRLVASIALDV